MVSSTGPRKPSLSSLPRAKSRNSLKTHQKKRKTLSPIHMIYCQARIQK
jgi:hypothetical protein